LLNAGLSSRLAAIASKEQRVSKDGDDVTRSDCALFKACRTLLHTLQSALCNFDCLTAAVDMEETAGEELNRLRAELASSRQLLTSQDAKLSICKDELLACRDKLLACKDKLLAMKDELLASRAAEPQRCQELLQHSAAAIQ
jgi:hypothetical protein